MTAAVTGQRAAGASEREVFEAVEVGIETAGGPGTVSAQFALDVMDDVFKRGA